MAMKRPELLMPAGNLEKLRTAILYGADAVYLGVAGFSLRAQKAEFSLSELEMAVAEAHQAGVRVYVAVNILASNDDLEKLPSIAEHLQRIKVDGVIISDPGVLMIFRELAPEIPVHLSTQANTTNLKAVRFWQQQGVQRVVPARELNLTELAGIANAVPEVEVEAFIHGAMCVAYSGRCFLSTLRTGRSSNQGECTQPCRWEYRLQESARPEEPLILEDDGRFSYLLSSKDLCMIEYLPELIKAGVASFKIEGRMKSAYYVAAVTRAYRWAIDSYLADPEGYTCQAVWLEELRKASYRGFTTGFYFRDQGRVAELAPNLKYIQTHELIATVLEYDAKKQRVRLGVRNRLSNHEELELLLRDKTIKIATTIMQDLNEIPVQLVHNGAEIWLPLAEVVPVGTVLRREIKK